MLRRAGLVFFLIAMMTNTAAIASDTQDFKNCDGRLKPKRQDDGLRGEASSAPYEFTPTPEITVQTCSRVLQSPLLLPTQKLRRAHLLRARAAAYLELDQTDSALTDLDAAEAEAVDLAADPFYQRSMGPSLKLLRAIALAKKQDFSAAVPFAKTALAARPYALQVQSVGSAILQAARPLGTPSPSPWQTSYRLEPDMAKTALISEFTLGNFNQVVAIAPIVTLSWPDRPLQPFEWSTQTPSGREIFNAVIVSLRISYARAATGDSAGARRGLTDVQDHLAKIRAMPKPEGQKESALYNPQQATEINAALDKYIKRQGQRIDARIAVSESRYDDATRLLLDAELPKDAGTLEVFSALSAAMPAKDRGRVPDLSSIRRDIDADRRGNLNNIIKVAMIAPETNRSVIDYEKSRPNILSALVGGALSMGTTLLNGIDRTSGFRSTPNADGTVKVEFVGNTPSAALVQEMTLLRAAELTRTAGKPAFIIVDRTDYSRTLNTSRGGMLISSVPTGFQTQLIVRFVDAGVEVERALDATKVIDALGPYYYQAKGS